MVANQSLTFKLFGVDVSASKALKGVGASAGSAEKGFVGLASAGARVAASLAVAAAGAIKAGKAAAADEAAQKRLALELRNVAGATDEQVAAVEDWITAQGKALGVTDDKLRPAMQRLARSTGDVGEAQELATLATDASAATGKDLQAISDALAKAHDGNAGALGRLGIKTKDAAGETLAFDKIVESMGKTFAGQAASGAETLEGKMARLSTATGEAEEALGEAFIPTLTKAVDLATAGAQAFAAVPEPIRDTTVSLVAMGAAAKFLGPLAMAIPGVSTQLGLLGAGFKDARVAQSAFSGRMGTLGGGLRSVATGATAAAGPIGAVAAVLGATALAAEHFEQVELDRKMSNLARALDEAAIAGESMSEAVYRGGLDEMVAAIERGSYSVDGLREQFDSLDDALVKMTPDMAAKRFEELAAEAESAGWSVDQLRAQLPDYAAKTREAARASAEQAESEEDKADSLEGAMDAMLKSVRITQTLMGSTDALAGMTGRLKDAVEESGKSLNARTESGRKNRRALSDEVDTVLTHTQAVIDNAEANGATTEKAYAKGRAALVKGKAALIDAAVAAGYSRAEAKKYVDQILKIPAKRSTDINADASDAISTVQDVRNWLAGLPTTRVINIIGRYVGTGGITGYDPRTGTYRRAAGGPVWGPGTSTSDSIPAMLSNGEYVMSAAAVARYGLATMDAMNARRLSGGGAASAVAATSSGSRLAPLEVRVFLDGREIRRSQQQVTRRTGLTA